MIGDPVGQSLSPLLHNTAFAAAGLDWVYVAFPVAAGRGADAVAAVRALGLAGLSVTMPHKEAVAGAVDRLSEVAARLGAVNTVIRDGDAVVGDNTDGAGLLDSLRAAHGWAPAGRRCVVLGT
ncbi:MAG: shikimate dehydrogenase family protein, partial [Acidimicrobiales bacterium]